LVYLLKNAHEFNIDRRKVILMGGSAGAHLALLAGLQSPHPIYDGGCKYSDIKISGIISKYGPTDLLTWSPATKKGSASSTWLGDKVNDKGFIESLSPVNYVSSGTRKIPVLFIHGSNDKTVPLQQSHVLYDKLKANGNETELHIVKDGKHGNFNASANEIMNAKMIDFIKKCVK